MKLYLFTMQGCIPCKRMKEEVLPKVFDETKIEIEVVDCNDEKMATLMSGYHVMSAPTTIIEADDGRYERLLNYQPVESVIEAINAVKRGDIV